MTIQEELYQLIKPHILSGVYKIAWVVDADGNAYQYIIIKTDLEEKCGDHYYIFQNMDRGIYMGHMYMHSYPVSTFLSACTCEDKPYMPFKDYILQLSDEQSRKLQELFLKCLRKLNKT